MALLREQINDLYRIEIRKLRDRCRAGEFPSRARAARRRTAQTLSAAVDPDRAVGTLGPVSREDRAAAELIRCGAGLLAHSTAQHLNSGIFPNGSRTGLVSMLAAAS